MKLSNSKTIAKKVILLSILAICSTSVFTQTVAEKQRQFDFWLGEWAVNLRVRQKDFTWKNQHKSVARIYSILDGKAVLELWSENENGINGYSLRYYNPKKDKWDLWLNWAGKNRSGTSGMECTFRHKRGECFSERKIDEKTNLISRFTFSDALPNTVRWDDAFSRDGGKTWSNNWIMEFSRRKQKAPAIAKDKNLLTYFNGNRCDSAEFETLKKLPANHKNNSKLSLYNILDGCIIIGFIENNKQKAFFTFTYNTYAKVYELAYLDKKDSNALSIYYGVKTDNGFSLQTRGGKEKAIIKSDKTIKSIELDYGNEKRKLIF